MNLPCKGITTKQLLPFREFIKNICQEYIFFIYTHLLRVHYKYALHRDLGILNLSAENYAVVGSYLGFSHSAIFIGFVHVNKCLSDVSFEQLLFFRNGVK